MMRAELVWDSRCALGEGAVWDVDGQSLFFVDILGREVLAFTPATGLQRRWPLPQMVGWVVPRRVGGWLAGLEQGIAGVRFDPDGTVALEWLQRLHAEGSPMRLNDAKADGAGRLWFGSMRHRNSTGAEGNFYRWQAGSPPVAVDGGYGVTNGPAISPDGRTLYHTDSPKRTVFAFDLAPDGSLSNKRSWLSFAPDEGFPDGMACDAQGHVWIAHWGGARVTERASDGRVVRSFPVPAAHTSNVCFGGPDLRDLYITTARAGVPPGDLAGTPAAGGLFVVRGAGQGLAACSFAG